MQLPTNFNGVLFLLKEPHRDKNDNPQSENVWPERLLNDDMIHGTKYDRGAVTKFRNRFREMLPYVNLSADELKNCAFFNVNPLGGGSVVSETYMKIDKGYTAKIIISDVNPKFIFTCSDIYSELKKEYFILPSDEIVGIRYANKSLKSFNHHQRQFFEIVHPTRSPKVLLPLDYSQA